jgi:hypothetical protein
MWLRESVLVPNAPTSLQTALAAEAPEDTFCLTSRRWTRKSLWYTEQELEDEQFPK